MLNKSLPANSRYIGCISTNSKLSIPDISNLSFKNISSFSGKNLKSNLPNSSDGSSYHRMKNKLDKNDYYRQRIFDKDLLNESKQVLELEKDDIMFYRKKVSILSLFIIIPHSWRFNISINMRMIIQKEGRNITNSYLSTILIKEAKDVMINYMIEFSNI